MNNHFKGAPETPILKGQLQLFLTIPPSLVGGGLAPGQAVILSKFNRKVPKPFDAIVYRERNLVDRFFGRLRKSFRRIATRYKKTASNTKLVICRS